jgi:hypothetical protein
MKLNEEISRIKNIMGVLNEQSSSTLIPDEGYDIIRTIEKNFSFTDEAGNIKGFEYKGNDKEENIKNAIKETIGLSYWKRISNRLKIQIYAFMYQTDSKEKTLLRWLAGLAQAINPNIDRLSIVNQPLDSPNVISAINLIRKTIDDDEINKIYNNYINVLKNQYNGITGSENDEANKLKIWGPRPEAIDKLMNGESWDDVKKWWLSKIKTDQATMSKNKITSNQSSETPNKSTQQSSVNPTQQSSVKPTQQSSVKPNEIYNHNYKPRQVWMGTNNKTNKEYIFLIGDISKNEITAISYNPRTENYERLTLDVTKPGIFGYSTEKGDFINLKQIE